LQNKNTSCKAHVKNTTSIEKTKVKTSHMEKLIENLKPYNALFHAASPKTKYAFPPNSSKLSYKMGSFVCLLFL